MQDSVLAPPRFVVTHMVPDLPPGGGVADFAWRLAARLAEVSSGAISSRFLVAGPRTSHALPEDAVDARGASSAARLLDCLREEAARTDLVLLHYSGYGYARRGAPAHLATALEGFANRRPVVTFFHELFARSYLPWRSSFWVTAAQRGVTRRLARTSRGLWTNSQVSRHWLMRQAAAPVGFAPIFSNVGEPSDLPLFEQRAPAAIVFGGFSLGSGLGRLRRERRLARALCAARAETVLHIGRAAPLPPRLAGRPVVPLGWRPAAEVSALLRDTRLALWRYPLSLATKSGVAAAYLAHGVPIMVFDGGRPTEPLVGGVHYWPAESFDGRIGCQDLAEVSQAGTLLYRAYFDSRLLAERILKGLASTLAHHEASPSG